MEGFDSAANTRRLPRNGLRRIRTFVTRGGMSAFCMLLRSKRLRPRRQLRADRVGRS